MQQQLMRTYSPLDHPVMSGRMQAPSNELQYHYQDLQAVI
jgi:hypothetical protein